MPTVCYLLGNDEEDFITVQKYNNLTACQIYLNTSTVTLDDLLNPHPASTIIFPVPDPSAAQFER